MTAAIPLPMPGMSGHFRSGFAAISTIRSGIAFHGRSRIAVAADAKAILACDLHQVGGLSEQTARFACFPSSVSLRLTPKCWSGLRLPCLHMSRRRRFHMH